MFIDFRERGRERERDREKHQCERGTLISCILYTSQPGMEPLAQVSALPGNWTRNLLVCGTMLQQTEPPGQALHEPILMG